MSEPTAEPGADASVVHVIESSYRYRDADNYDASVEKILEDEGWFADEKSARIRCEQLNAQNRKLYDVTMARLKRQHDAKIAAAEETNREAAILRKAGINKRDVAVPAPFVPTPFDDYVPEAGHTTYDVLPIRRSDHDGIAQAVTSG